MTLVNFQRKLYQEKNIIKMELSEIRYFSQQKLLNRILNNFKRFTEKSSALNFIKQILEINYLYAI